MTNFYFDVETCPQDKEKYLATTDDEERKKLLNPIDSRIVAIGIKQKGKEPVILLDFEDEKKMLEEFWEKLAHFKKEHAYGKIVGFNVKNFDLPFVVTRSFINNVKIVPFVLKDVVELREQLSAFKYGNVRGKLKEFAVLMGIEVIEGLEGDKVAELCWSEDKKTLGKYLRKDLEITEKVHERIVELNIDKIAKW